MMRMLTICSIAATTAASNSFLGKTLGSYMVLQRDSSSKLYGYSAAADTKIFVSFVSYQEDFTVTTISSRDLAVDGGYRWVALLPPKKGSLNEYSVNITSSAGESAFLESILFGDVFMCSGQSNMQFAVPGDFDATAEIAAANNYPFIRIMNVGQSNNLPQADSPLEDLYFLDRTWEVGSSSSVDGGYGEWYRYSAVCWFFGKNIFDNSLQRSIPVGLVSDNWGGTIVEAWSPPSVIQECGESANKKGLTNPDTHINQRIKDEDEFNPNAYSVLYNTMIYPFRDMNIKGVLWYQGESNVGDSVGYPCLQNGMTKAWRDLFGVDFAFMYVQLATWDNGGNGVLADFRLAQTSILSITNYSAMITAADLGDPESPYDPIHPRNKTEVGRRLALAASSLIYGSTDVAYLGPIVTSVTAFEDAIYGWSVRIAFDESSCAEGLHLEAPQKCPDCSAENEGGCGEVLLEYSTQKQTKIQVRVNVVISGQFTVDFIPLVKVDNKPLNLLYCLGDYPLMTIYNSFGIPVMPFSVAVPT